MWSAGNFVASGANDPKIVRGFHSLLHEAIHGTNKLMVSAFRGKALLIEEVTTDLLASRILQSEFGLPFQIGPRYNEIRWMAQRVKKALESVGGRTSELSIQSILRRVSFRFRKAGRFGEEHLADVDEYIERFVEAFDDKVLERYVGRKLPEEIRLAKSKKFREKLLEEIKREKLPTL
jgi:hypothetical protein